MINRLICYLKGHRLSFIRQTKTCYHMHCRRCDQTFKREWS